MLTIFDFLFPYEKLTIYPEDMRTILGYQARISRGQEPFVDSECSPANPMQLHRIYNGKKEKFDYETPSAAKSRTE